MSIEQITKSASVLTIISFRCFLFAHGLLAANHLKTISVE